MLTDALLPNLVLFLLGQGAACFHLRTGRRWVGLSVSGALWVLIDWYCVARLVFAATGAAVVVPLAAMQAIAVLAPAWLAIRLVRRRWSATARQRHVLFGAALAAYLRGDLAAARSTFRRIVRSDPWDCAAWVALGNVERSAGDMRRAARAYWRGRGVDIRSEFADLIAHQRSRSAPKRPAANAAAVAAVEASLGR